jgi:flagellar hook-associated protein 2
MSSVSALNSLLDSSSNSIDLSQILEAAMGASTPGIDVNDAVSAAVTAAEAPEKNWETQESTLQSQSSALSQIQSYAESLDSDMQSLNSLTGPLSAADVTSSNSSVVTGTAATGAATGQYVVEINNLATTDAWSSTAVANSTSALPSGESFTITTGTGSDTITVGSNGVNTLSDLASAVNSANLGVTANIITDASGSRLSIVSNSSGSSANFTVTSSDPTNFGLTEAPGGGQNASLTVNGISISSASNTVTGAVPGLTLNLLSADPGTQATLSVSPDTSQVSSAINQFVSDYNTLLSAVNSQFTYTAGSGQGVLADDPTVRNLQSVLLGVLGYTNTPASGSTSVSSLSSLGITVQTDGALSVNNTQLQNALQNNFSGVQSFFQGSALNGFANSLDQQLTNFTSPADGAFTVDLQSMNTETTGLQTDITNFQTNVIGPLQTQLQSEYSQAEIALQQLPDEIRNIDQELGMNNSSSNG